jgi:hypothetical protein
VLAQHRPRTMRDNIIQVFQETITPTAPLFIAIHHEEQPPV